MINDNKAPGLLEYILFKNATLSAVLATLIATSFISLGIIYVSVDSPAKAEQSSEKKDRPLDLSFPYEN